jgi:hypothetical protein
MSIKLATPKTETLVKVIQDALVGEINIDVTRKRITLHVLFGKQNEKNFVTEKRKVVIIEGTDFEALAQKAVDSKKNIYDNIGTICYTWLQEKGQLTV